MFIESVIAQGSSSIRSNVALSGVSTTNAFRSALRAGDAESVRNFLAFGFPGDLSWEDGSTPLIYAAGNDAVEVMDVLFKNGVRNLEARATFGKLDETALLRAARHNKTRAALLLIKHGAEIRARTADGWMSLMYAALNDDVRLAARLLEKNSDPIVVDARTSRGWTPLMLACERGSFETAKLLISNHADVNLFVSTGDSNRPGNIPSMDFTPLALANRGHFVELARYLIAHGARGKACAPVSETNVTKNGFDFSVKKSGFYDRPMVVLTAGEDSHKRLEVKVVPSLGNRIFSLVFNTNELLAVTNDFNVARSWYGGIPLLFPTPGSVAEGSFVFNGENVVMKAPSDPLARHWHGLAINANWPIGVCEITREGVRYTAKFALDDSHPLFAAFPYRNTLTVNYLLTKDSLCIGYRVENTGGKPFGFGFGSHPFWRVVASPQATRLEVDVAKVMEETKSIPSGSLLPVAGGPCDWRVPKSIPLIQDINPVYFKVTPQSRIFVHYDALGLSVSHEATEDFTHLVTWVPEGRNCLSLENQTCANDAHNLFARGRKNESHLKVLRPGMSHSGRVYYHFLIK